MAHGFKTAKMYIKMVPLCEHKIYCLISLVKNMIHVQDKILQENIYGFLKFVCHLHMQY